MVIYDYAELVLFHTLSGRPCKNCLGVGTPIFHQAKSIPIQMPLTLWNHVKAKEKNNSCSIEEAFHKSPLNAFNRLYVC